MQAGIKNKQCDENAVSRSVSSFVGNFLNQCGVLDLPSTRSAEHLLDESLMQIYGICIMTVHGVSLSLFAQTE